jgi:hypothetical protein
MISVRINSPGCGGFNIGIAAFSSNSVIILKIHIADFVLGMIDPERHPQGPRNVQASCAFPATGQKMRFPHRQSA